jgi:molecular chaperone DnaK
MAKFFGIDFGTTNSAVVQYDSQATLHTFTHIGDGDEPLPMPSVVAVDNLTQEVKVGREVKNRIIKLREGGKHLVIESVKSLLDADEVWSTPANVWRPEDIAARLFAALSAKAQSDVGAPIRQAVVAIPVGMSPAKRAALRRAARTAGTEILSFISEPTAAFIAHSEELRHCRYAVVFDWGGGTLDVSVVEAHDGCIVERHTEGSIHAGDFIDLVFARWLHTQIAERHGLRLPFEGVAPDERHILITEAERVKRHLQSEGTNTATIKLGRYAGLKLVEQAVTTGVFDGLITRIVSEALDLLIRSVAEARISQHEIGKLIVVGGTSNLSLLKSELRRRWPQPNIIFPNNAEWDIARGAAWLAAHPGRHRTAEGVGVVLADEEYHDIFRAGTDSEAAKAKLHFGLVEDAATATFVFASRTGGVRPTRLGELHVESFGFRDELIELDCRITPDLVFEAEALSKAKTRGSVSFSYDKLRWMYEMPEPH